MGRASWNIRQGQVSDRPKSLNDAASATLGPVVDELLNDPMSTMDWGNIEELLRKNGHNREADELADVLYRARTAMDDLIEALGESNRV